MLLHFVMFVLPRNIFSNDKANPLSDLQFHLVLPTVSFMRKQFVKKGQ
jgi:hypothetical protein